MHFKFLTKIWVKSMWKAHWTTNDFFFQNRFRYVWTSLTKIDYIPRNHDRCGCRVPWTWWWSQWQQWSNQGHPQRQRTLPLVGLSDSTFSEMLVQVLVLVSGYWVLNGKCRINKTILFSKWLINNCCKILICNMA